MGRFENKVAVITGGMHGIGMATAERFREEGATALVIDLKEGGYFQGDLSKKEVLEEFVAKVIDDYGHIDYLVNNALPLMKGIDECSYEEFEYALKVGVTAPFYLSKLFAPHFSSDGAIINISSSRAHMSQAQTESYSAAKGGISSLTHAMANSFAGRIRVNSISPGWIETYGETYEGADADQQLVGRVGEPNDIANAVLFLCSSEAGFIDGVDLRIDGGMTKQMIYHDDQGWFYEGRNTAK